MTDKQQKRQEKNLDYWRDRQGLAQAKLSKKNVKEVEKQLQKYYQSTMEKTIGQFEKVYLKVKAIEDVGGNPTPADLYKLDAYWQLQGQLRDELTKLGDKQAALFSKSFMKQYTDFYEAKALKTDLFFGQINRETAQQMIESIWCADGKSWRQRIGINNERLREALNDNLIHCVLTGQKPSELKRILQHEFGMDYRRADTIVRTEMAHIQTEATKQRYLDSGIQRVEVWADYDERRCDICGNNHKKKYYIGEDIPVPAHPNCRCCILPVVD